MLQPLRQRFNPALPTLRLPLQQLSPHRGIRFNSAPAAACHTHPHGASDTAQRMLPQRFASSTSAWIFLSARIALGTMILVSYSQPLYLSLPAGLFGNIRTNKHVLRSCFGCRFLTQNLPPTFVSGLVPDLIFQCLASQKFEAPEVENLGVQIKPNIVDVLKNSFSKSFLGSVVSNLALCWVTSRSCKSYPTFAPQRLTKSDFLLWLASAAASPKSKK